MEIQRNGPATTETTIHGRCGAHAGGIFIARNCDQSGVAIYPPLNSFPLNHCTAEAAEKGS